MGFEVGIGSSVRLKGFDSLKTTVTMRFLAVTDAFFDCHNMVLAMSLSSKNLSQPPFLLDFPP